MWKSLAILVVAAGAVACGSVVEPTDSSTQNNSTSCPTGQAYSVAKAKCMTDAWGVALVSLDFQLATDDGMYARQAEGGYAWARLTLNVTNKTHTERCFNWISDTVNLALPNGDVYTMRMAFNGVSGYLPKCYEPGQSKQGFVVFQLPQGETIDGAVLSLTSPDFVEQVFTLSVDPPTVPTADAFAGKTAAKTEVR